MERKTISVLGMTFEVPNFGKYPATKIKLEGQDRPVLVTTKVLEELQASGTSMQVLYETEVGFISYEGQVFYIELSQFYTSL